MGVRRGGSLLISLSSAVVLALTLAVFLVPWYLWRHGVGAREWFLVTWAAPAVLVYTLVHFGQAGYVLTFLPAVVIFLSHVLLVSLGSALPARPRLRVAVAVSVVVLVVLANGSFWVSARPSVRLRLGRGASTRDPVVEGCSVEP